MRLKAFICALHAALFAILLAVSPAGSGSMTLLGAGTGGGGACSDTDATAWQGAVVGAGGSVSATQYGYVCTLITAYKSAGVWTLLDREWLYASENATQAAIDIKGLSTHTLVDTGSGNPAFTANRGYDWGTFAGYINTGYAGGTNFTLNANSFGAYVRTNRISGSAAAIMGVTSNGTQFNFFRPLNGSSNIEFDDNSTTFPAISNPGASAMGSYIFSRTSSSSISVYRNASSLGASASTVTSATTINWFILCYNNGGSPNSAASDQVASVFMGGTMNGTQAAAKNLALNNYMTSVGANVY